MTSSQIKELEDTFGENLNNPNCFETCYEYTNLTNLHFIIGSSWITEDYINIWFIYLNKQNLINHSF